MKQVRIKVIGRVTHWLREDRSVFTQLDFDGVPKEKGVIRGIYEKVDLDKLYEQHFGKVDVVPAFKEKVKENIVKVVPEKELSEEEKVVPVVRRKRRDGTSLRTEQRRRKKFGMSNKVGRPMQIDWDSVKDECLKRYEKGDSIGDICKDSGISVSSFYRVVLKGGSNV